jgi:hypothetical protein
VHLRMRRDSLGALHAHFIAAPFVGARGFSRSRAGHAPRGVRLEGRCRELDDVLIGLYLNRVIGNLIATHLHSEARFDEMEALYSPKGYFAMGLQAANSGMDHKIVPSSD